MEADARIGTAEYYRKYWTETWPKQQLELFNKESFFVQFIK